jgi:ParB family chromosome partitioning protein
MAKLSDNIKNSGMNSGAQVLGKMMRVSEIEEDPEISNIFQVHKDVFQAILQDIQKNGFDIAEPPVLWKGKKIVVDGRTRVRAAKAAGVLEIPVVEREFESLDDAKLYCYKRQAERRNLTQSEIFTVAVELGIKINRDGNGRGSEMLAKEMGLSPAVIQKARIVAKHGSEEDIEAVKNNELTINSAYEKLRKKKNEKTEPEEEQAGSESLPEDELETVGDIESGDILGSALEEEYEEAPVRLDSEEPVAGVDTAAEIIPGIFNLLINNNELQALKIILNEFGHIPVIAKIIMKDAKIESIICEIQGRQTVEEDISL